jgi:hypothetical protein
VSKHLWEIDHPYYCTEGCYYVGSDKYADVHADWASWADFKEAWGKSDPDYNLLFRWDWARTDPSDYEYEVEEDPAFEMPGDNLQLFYFLQRKAKPFSHHINVTEDDEEDIREWLTNKADHMRKLWEPLLDEPQP